jgi:hypothetical protein
MAQPASRTVNKGFAIQGRCRCETLWTVTKSPRWSPDEAELRSTLERLERLCARRASFDLRRRVQLRHRIQDGSDVLGMECDMDQNVGLTVRIAVKLRPDEYDELFRHVRRIGTTMSAFLRESAANAIREDRPLLDRALSPAVIPTAPD